MNHLSDVEVAWLAGILEGEGCFLGIRAPNGVFKGRITCNMTDADIVARVHRMLPSSRFRGPCQQKNPKHKPYYQVSVHRRDEIKAVLERLYPLMGSRRQERFREILQLMEDCPRQATARHGTRHMYESHKCRCKPCRDSHAERFRRLRARNRVASLGVRADFMIEEYERHADHAQGSTVQA